MIHKKYEVVEVEMLPEEFCRLLSSVGVGNEAKDVEVDRRYSPEAHQRVVVLRFTKEV